MSTEPTWRVYLTEWLFAYTADALGVAGDDECLSVFRRRYEGRVSDEDWRVVPAIRGRPSEVRSLQLRMPNRRGEFKDYNDAVRLASDLLDQDPAGGNAVAVVVQRGSDEEKALLDYGKKKLPDAG